MMLLMAHIAALKLPKPTTEYKFSPTRRWRFDFAWPDKMLALEIEGGVFVNGRHTRGKAYEADCEKYNTALVMGWRVLRVTTDQVKRGEAIKWLQDALIR